VLCTLKCLPLSRMITAFFSLSAMALPSPYSCPIS
jgi:hypothetical protein